MPQCLSNRSREVFVKSVVPQLRFNDKALAKTLIKDAVPMGSGVVSYKIDKARFDRFFAALSYGIVYKTCGASLPVAR